jgi:hypothetical protein
MSIDVYVFDATNITINVDNVEDLMDDESTAGTPCTPKIASLLDELSTTFPATSAGRFPGNQIPAAQPESTGNVACSTYERRSQNKPYRRSSMPAPDTSSCSLTRIPMSFCAHRRNLRTTATKPLAEASAELAAPEQPPVTTAAHASLHLDAGSGSWRRGCQAG